MGYSLRHSQIVRDEVENSTLWAHARFPIMIDEVAE